MAAPTKPKAVNEAELEAKKIIDDANAEANKIIAAAGKTATEMLTDSETLFLANANLATKLAIEKIDGATTFSTTLYMVNPYTQDKFKPGELTEKVTVDSWVISQVAAGILTPITEEA